MKALELLNELKAEILAERDRNEHELRTRILDQNKQIETLMLQVESLQEQLSERPSGEEMLKLHSERRRQQNKIDSMHMDIDALQEKLQEARNTIMGQAMTIEGLKAERYDLRERIAMMEEMRDELTGEEFPA